MSAATEHKISNLGRLTTLILASKAVSYWAIPATMMGMAQLAAEDIWMVIEDHDYNNTKFLNTDLIRSVGTKTADIFGGVFDKIGVLWSGQFDLMKLLEILLIMLCICAVIYGIRNFTKIVMCVGLYDNYYIHKMRQRMTFTHSSLITDASEQIQIINEYLEKNNLFIQDYGRYMHFRYTYDVLPAASQRRTELLLYSRLYIPAVGVRYYFNDQEAKTNGYIIWLTQEITVNIVRSANKDNGQGVMIACTEDRAEKTTIPVLKLVINCKVNEYIKYINNQNSALLMLKNTYFYHITKASNEKCNYGYILSEYQYKGDFQKYFKNHYAEEEQKKWIDTFFHPYRKVIWPKLQTIHFNPEDICRMGQYPQASYCLYGPPGTGKSTLVYRTAKALGRSILSVNLCGFNTSLELRKLLTCSKLSSYIESANNHYMVGANDAIIVFDEFDRALLALKARADLKSKREAARLDRMNKLNTFNYGRGGHVRHWSIPEFPDSPESPVFLGYPGYQGYQMKHYENNQTKVDKESTNVDKESTKADSKPETVDDQMKSAINDFIQMDDDDLTIDSLLDIIQGACANPGTIIFAITNKYEELRDICPRLFRDGRFKPIYFGYPTRETVDEITQHYMLRSIMGREFDFIPDVIRIPTARLTNRAVDLHFCHLNDKETQFQNFIKHLKYDLENYKLADSFKEYERCSDTDLISTDSNQSQGSSRTPEPPGLQ